MQVFGFTLNLLTLLAIVLSVGLVVDDAIVMVENVERHLREGERPFEAALIGARELVGPIIAMTITLAAVYAPIGFQGGLTGSLFREFAFTLAGAVIVSGVVALTLSPMMASKLLRAGDTRARLRRLDQPPLRRPSATATCACSPASLRYRPVMLTPVGRSSIAADHSVLPVLAEGAGADGRPGRHLRHRPGGAELHHRPDQAATPTQVNEVFDSFPETEHTFQLTFPSAASAAWWLKPWSQRQSAPPSPDRREVVGQDCRRSPASRSSPPRPGRCPAAAISRSNSSSPPRPSRSELVEFAQRSSCRRPSPAACSCSPTPT